MKSSGVTVITLLAIVDGGCPYYDVQTAQRIAAMGIPCFACTPEKLPQLLERALKGQDVTALAKSFESKKANRQKAAWSISMRPSCMHFDYLPSFSSS